MREFSGQWRVRAGRTPQGWCAELSVPGDWGHVTVSACVTPQAAARIRDAVRAYHVMLHQGGDVSGDLAVPLVCGCGEIGYLAPVAHALGGGGEVGDLGGLLGGLLGGGGGGLGQLLGGGGGGGLGQLLGGGGGGGLGQLLGGGGGGGLGQLLGGGGLQQQALGRGFDVLSGLGGFFGGGGDVPGIAQMLLGGGAPAQRPASLPQAGSEANRRRILAHIGVSPNDPPERIAAALRQGLTQGWAPADLADARAMLEQLQGGRPLFAPPTGPAQSLPGVSQLLQALGMGAVSPQGAAPILTGFGALSQGLQGLSQSPPTDPLAALLAAAAMGLDARAGAISGDLDAAAAWERARWSHSPLAREGVRLAHALSHGG